MPTSIHLIFEEALRAEDAQRRRGDAIDTKAGIVLGFAGVLAGLAFDASSQVVRLVAVPAALSAFLALQAYALRPFPAIDARRLRDRYLSVDESETRRRLLDTRLDVIARTEGVLRNKARRVKASTWMLGASIAAVAVAAILNAVQEVLR